MHHTVVGLFESRAGAQQAVQELIRAGYTQDNIDLSNRTYSDAAASTTAPSTGSGTGVADFFNSLFDNDQTTAANYTNAAHDADAILTVHVESDESARRAAEILDRNGAIDVDDHSAQQNQQNLSTNQGTQQGTANAANNQSIPVIEEQLQVGKREIERGGARIRSRIVEKPVEATVRLREEHVVVNRRPVNRDVTEADMGAFREGSIELTEHAEVPVVAKQAKVVEEVEVSKQVTERDQTIRDTVRHTDVDVQETGGDVSEKTSTRGASS
jgi:uncharacterized protein (TIGR02271 family)